MKSNLPSLKRTMYRQWWSEQKLVTSLEIEKESSLLKKKKKKRAGNIAEGQEAKFWNKGIDKG